MEYEQVKNTSPAKCNSLLYYIVGVRYTFGEGRQPEQQVVI
jgi:hypothetical protein